MTMPEPKPVTGKPPSRWSLYLPAGAFLVLCAGWSAFWYLAATSTEAALDDWFVQEKQIGRVWTCPDKSVGGFPFRIEIRCTGPKFSGRLAGMSGSGSVGDLLVAANLYNPALIVAEIASPLAFRSESGAVQVGLSWKLFRASHRSRNGAFEAGSLELDEANLRIEGAGVTVVEGQATKFETHLRPNPDRDPAVAALDLAVRISGARAPILDSFTGEPAPLDGVILTTILRSDAIMGSNFGTAAERWRNMRGSIEVREVKAAKGDARIEASGQFDLDAAHRPHGSLALQASGLSPILQRYGVPVAGLAIGDLLGGLLGGGRPPAEKSGPAALQLPLTLENGRVSIGPVRLPLVLRPLY